MISFPIRYMHIGRLMSRSRKFLFFTIMLIIIFAFTPFFGHVALTYLTLYVVSPLYTWRIRPDIASKENAENLAKTQLAVNSNGTSLRLGGSDRLRSFPEGRFQGAYTIYYATEFRWNYSSSGGEKLDLFFIQDLVEELQLAFFFEQGSVSEKKSDLGKTVKYSLGSGFRFLSGSGNVYRADFATGNEGPNFSVIIQYPWTYRL